jgi:ribosomal protein S18 acetylase RimI-like enzyme
MNEIDYDVLYRTYNLHCCNLTVNKQVAALSRATFDCGLTFAQLTKLIKHNRRELIVAFVKDKVIGYALIRKADSKTIIDELAVIPELKRQRIGTGICDAVLCHAAHNGTYCIHARIPESNLVAQLLFKSFAFLCVKIERNAIAATGEDAYLFELDLS